jgi:DNA mismatch repair protein MutS
LITVYLLNMAFQNILYKNKREIQATIPDFFVDLNLDQVVNAVIYGKEEYELAPHFYTPLHEKDEILYRQQVMKDLQKNSLFAAVQKFAESLQIMRQLLPKEKDQYYLYQKERFFLDATDVYCKAVDALAVQLSNAEFISEGFTAFREYLNNYRQSATFQQLKQETEQLLADLSSITYCVVTKELKVQVIYYKSEPNYSDEVERTFEKFKKTVAKDYKVKFSASGMMNHVEAAILEGVAKLFPEIFKRLVDFNTRHISFQDETIKIFDRQIQFYIAFLTHISALQNGGLKFCYPEILTDDKNVCNYEGFDLALAHKLVAEKKQVITNDFYLENKERIIIISGPNQGGKTTFARTFGQLHYLAALGCPVPGRESKLFLSDNIFTHFEKEENTQHLRSKLEDDLIRIHAILERSTSRSIIIMNEILSSTTLEDAIFLSKRIMETIDQKDILCVWVTFIDQLLSFSNKTVSMVSTVVPDNPAQRTFKVIRKPADGLAYALSIAEKYGVTYDLLKKRIQL